MRHKSIKGRALATALLALPILLPGQSPSSPRQHMDSGARVSEVARLAGNTSKFKAVFELNGDSLIAHLDQSRQPQLRGHRMGFASADARQYESGIKSEQHAFEAQAAAIDAGIRIIAAVTRVANAVVIEARGDTLARISALPHVRGAELDRPCHRALDKSVPLIAAPAAWAELGGAANAGEGMKIAIIDTGIDIHNPLFSDAGFTAPSGFPLGDAAFTNNKVIAARAFLDDPTATPADENGHGTNVAGIAAGDFNTPSPLGPISGVAPAAFLGNYRALDSTGSGDSLLVGAAVEAAVSDGFDIINLSLEVQPAPQLSFLDNTVEQAVAAGVVVVAAAGNDGESGGSISSPGIAPDAITVAASSNSHNVGPAVSVAGPAPSSLQNLAATVGVVCGVDFSPLSAPLPCADEASLDKKKRGCRASRLPAGSMAGKIALEQRGDCTFSQKINNLQAAGAAAVLIYNEPVSESSDGGDTTILMDATGTSIPSLFVIRSEGLAVQAWVDGHPGSEISFNPSVDFSSAPDVLAPFSSPGPTMLDTLKPDVSAPGVSVYSGAIQTCNTDGVWDPSGFTPVSGTSQASPHVAGAAALIKQIHPDWPPEQIKSALVNSATAPVQALAGSSGSASVLNAGSGRLDVGNAIKLEALANPASLSFGTHSLKAGADLSSTLQISSLVDATSKGFSVTMQPDAPDPGLTLAIDSSSLTITKGGTASVEITLKAKKSAGAGDHTGFIVVTGPSGTVLRVPYWIRLS